MNQAVIERAQALAAEADDITRELSAEVEELYFEKLAFPEFR